MSGVLIVGILTSSCGHNLERLNKAATTQGEALASVPPVTAPDDCRIREAHARLAVGMEIRSALKRERAALDRANDRVTRCADYFDDFNARQAGKQE